MSRILRTGLKGSDLDDEGSDMSGVGGVGVGSALGRFPSIKAM